MPVLYRCKRFRIAELEERGRGHYPDGPYFHRRSFLRQAAGTSSEDEFDDDSDDDSEDDDQEGRVSDPIGWEDERRFLDMEGEGSHDTGSGDNDDNDETGCGDNDDNDETGSGDHDDNDETGGGDNAETGGGGNDETGGGDNDETGGGDNDETGGGDNDNHTDDNDREDNDDIADFQNMPDLVSPSSSDELLVALRG